MDAMHVSFKGLTLHVRDVERARDFYLRIPGVVLEDDRPGQFALLRIGDTLLGLLRLGAPGFHLELHDPRPRWDVYPSASGGLGA